MSLTRREFLNSAALSSATAFFGATASADPAPPAPEHDHAAHNHPKPSRPAVPRLPAILCKVTGTVGIDGAYQILQQNGDTLDAALHVTSMQENDADDHTCGLGGLPNEDGEVQLDACCLHGPTRRGAAVAQVSNIKNASLLARYVMEHTAYPLMVGEGAQRMALAANFASESLLTDVTRKMYVARQQIEKTAGTWGPGVPDPAWSAAAGHARFLSASQQDLDTLVKAMEPYAVTAGLGPQWTWRAAYEALFPNAEPLYISAVNARNEISSAATSSGLPWRKCGAASDISVIGAGCYLDPAVGSAGASGNAEATIKISGARTIVENMRAGMEPEAAGLDALRRISAWFGNDIDALRFIEIVYYIMRKDGAYAGVSLWQGDKTGHVRQYTIHDGVRRSEDCRYLLDGNPPNGCVRCSKRVGANPT